MISMMHGIPQSKSCARLGNLGSSAVSASLSVKVYVRNYLYFAIKLDHLSYLLYFI